jgi:hypothetical protein
MAATHFNTYVKTVMSIFSPSSNHNSMEYRFASIQRGRVWKINYSNGPSTATLTLVLDQNEPRFEIKCIVPDDVTQVMVRQRLDMPLFRIPLLNSSTSSSGNTLMHHLGAIEMCLPSSDKTFNVVLQGKGKLVPTWESDIGLQGKHANTMSVTSSSNSVGNCSPASNE